MVRMILFFFSVVVIIYYNTEAEQAPLHVQKSFCLRLAKADRRLRLLSVHRAMMSLKHVTGASPSIDVFAAQ